MTSHRAARIEVICLIIISVIFFALPLYLAASQSRFLSHDNLYWYLPFFDLFFNGLRDGIYAWWNPYSHGGESALFALMQNHLLSPLATAVGLTAVVMDLDVFLGALLNRVVIMWVGGLGVYMFLRQWAEHVITRVLLSALIFLSPFVMNGFHQNGITDHNYLVGWVLYFSYKIICLHDYRSRNFVGLSVVYGQSFVSYFFVGPTLAIAILLGYGIVARRIGCLRQWRENNIGLKLLLSCILLVPALGPNYVVLQELPAYLLTIREVTEGTPAGLVDALAMFSGRDRQTSNLISEAFIRLPAMCFPLVVLGVLFSRGGDGKFFLVFGIFVIRMGHTVKTPLTLDHPRIIDYATNNMRSDFMDIYLGQKCFFAISSGAGWDGIPVIFRKPVVYVNYAPLGYLITFRSSSIQLSKRYWSKSKGRELTVSEIFLLKMAHHLRSDDFSHHSVELVENTPQEIEDAVREMNERLTGTWQSQPHDELLQKKFWSLFRPGMNNTQILHGAIRTRYSANYLRANEHWLM